MITREQIQAVVEDSYNQSSQTAMEDAVMTLIEQEREQYQALVGAVGKWKAGYFSERIPGTDKEAAIYNAYQSLFPPPSIADRLDALAGKAMAMTAEDLHSKRDEVVYPLFKELKALAAEYREKHGGGE